jgi:hypothetical protein
MRCGCLLSHNPRWRRCVGHSRLHVFACAVAFGVTQISINMAHQCPRAHTMPKQHARRTAFAVAEAPHAPHASRRNRDRGRNRATRTRSGSPTRAGQARGRYRSRSPSVRGGSPPYRQTDSQSRDGAKPSRRDKPEFFRAGTDSRGEVCMACLGRHQHPFGKCDGRKLWDGSPGSVRKSGQGKLLGQNGDPICYDWQLPKGCPHTSHPERHKCSGCGGSSHGAQACPRAEKA